MKPPRARPDAGEVAGEVFISTGSLIVKGSEDRLVVVSKWRDDRHTKRGDEPILRYGERTLGADESKALLDKLDDARWWEIAYDWREQATHVLPDTGSRNHLQISRGAVTVSADFRECRCHLVMAPQEILDERDGGPCTCPIHDSLNAFHGLAMVPVSKQPRTIVVDPKLAPVKGKPQPISCRGQHPPYWGCATAERSYKHCVARGKDRVDCYESPFTPGIAFRTDAPLKPDPPSPYNLLTPWAIELAGGEKCWDRAKDDWVCDKGTSISRVFMGDSWLADTKGAPLPVVRGWEGGLQSFMPLK